MVVVVGPEAPESIKHESDNLNPPQPGAASSSSTADVSSSASGAMQLWVCVWGSGYGLVGFGHWGGLGFRAAAAAFL